MCYVFIAYSFDVQAMSIELQLGSEQRSGRKLCLPDFDTRDGCQLSMVANMTADVDYAIAHALVSTGKSIPRAVRRSHRQTDYFSYSYGSYSYGSYSYGSHSYGGHHSYDSYSYWGSGDARANATREELNATREELNATERNASGSVV